MLLKKYLEKLDRRYSQHEFRKVSSNSKKIKKGDIFFFLLEGTIKMGIYLLMKLSKMEQKP